MGKNLITGLCRRGAAFHWTSMTMGPQGPAVVQTGAHTLEGEFDQSDPAALGAQLRRQCPQLSGPVSFALPPAGMLMRVMEFPAAIMADAEDLDNMVHLQMDKCSPFPEGRLQTAYEVLAETPEQSLVWMAGIQRDHVEFTRAMCRAAGLELLRLDAEAAVWWRLLCEHMQDKIEREARQIFLIMEWEELLMITLQAGVPVACKAINLSLDLPAAEYAEDLIQEVHSTSLSLDLEKGQAPLTDARLWCATDLAAQLPETLQARFDGILAIENVADLPPLCYGVAARMLQPPFKPATTARGARTVVDFTPLEWRTQAAERLLRRRLAVAAAVVFIVWLGLLTLLFGGQALEQRRGRQLESRLQTLKAPAEEVRTLQGKVRSFERSLARNRLALESLREISRLLPPDTNISSFQFKQGRQLILRGEASTVNPIYDFKQALDESRIFERTEMGSVQPGRRRNVTVQTFQITGFFPGSGQPR